MKIENTSFQALPLPEYNMKKKAFVKLTFNFEHALLSKTMFLIKGCTGKDRMGMSNSRCASRNTRGIPGNGHFSSKLVPRSLCRGWRGLQELTSLETRECGFISPGLRATSGKAFWGGNGSRKVFFAFMPLQGYTG